VLIIEPADAEQAVIDELEAAGFEAATSIPSSQLPVVFVRVVAVGGFQRDLVTDVPNITLEFFGRTESKASQAAARGIAVLQAAAREGHLGGETCHQVGVGALPQNYPLPSVQTHKRYITTIAPAIRRRAATI
jgi:hypothetical protein